MLFFTICQPLFYKFVIYYELESFLHLRFVHNFFSFVKNAHIFLQLLRVYRNSGKKRQQIRGFTVGFLIKLWV